MSQGFLSRLGDVELETELGAGLERVEALLESSVYSEDEFIANAARHLVAAGGKRFRPLLTLVAAALGDMTAAGVAESAVVVELTHLATLYHDDVMDEAARRRGTISANARWDNTVAILTGDFLFARASQLLADLGPEAVMIQAQTFERLVMGQIHETVGPVADEDPVAHHMQVLADKTGSLIATSAQFGAMFGGASESEIARVTAYGEKVGVAFQLADDIVDITSEGSVSGKTPGTDLREGILTLPGLLAMNSNDPQDQRLIELLQRPLPDDADHADALKLLRAHPALAAAKDEARRWADEAWQEVAVLENAEVKRALQSLCDFVVERSA